MEAKLLGVPLVVWGGICLVLAAVFAVFWPSARAAGDTTTLRFVILRWFHALVWLLLAAACFARAAGIGSAVNLVALAALPIYIVFIVALLSR